MHVHDLWRIIVLVVGAVNIFYAALIFVSVAGGWMRTSTYRRKVHVLAIATSYILVTLGLWLQIAGRALDNAPITWRLWFATIAFPLGIYAMLALTGFGEGWVSRKQRREGS